METTIQESISITENLTIAWRLPEEYPDESEILRNRIQNIFISPKPSTDTSKIEDTEVFEESQSNAQAGLELTDTLFKIFNNENNWDGYGTPKISNPLKQKCFEILEVIGRHHFNLPSVFPVCGGGMQFEWKAGNRELEIEFNEDEVSTLKTEKFADNRCRYIEDENINLDQIPELCLWLESIQI